MRFEGFEGGQSPLQRRLPKFGFNSPNRLRIATVSLGQLSSAFEAGSVVDEAALRKARLIKGGCDAVKVLGNGELEVNLKVRVNLASESAVRAIAAAGGVFELVPVVRHKDPDPRCGTQRMRKATT
jgi:large subunit ribosomal protein L15